MPLDQNKIPELSKIAANSFFHKLDARLPFDYSVLIFNFFVSKILCHNRVKISLNDGTLTFPNLYCLSFGDSGVGKTFTMKVMDEIIGFLYEDKDLMEKEWRKQREYEFEREADKEGMKGGKKTAYVKENMPRSLFSRLKSTSTPEGLAAVHETLNEAGFGEITWVDGEISDTMLRYRAGTSLDDIIVTMKEAYDNGAFDSKVIKGNKTLKAQGKTPYLAWLFGPMDDDDGKELFMRFLSMGFARRSIVCLIDDIPKDSRTVEQIDEDTEMAMQEKSFLIASLYEIYKRVKINLSFPEDNGRNKIFKLSGEARKVFIEYKQKCQNDSVSLPKSTSKILKIELAGRWWKALKLSCVFAVQNHEGEIIEVEDLRQAIEFCEYLGTHLNSFIAKKSRRGVSIAEGIIESLESNPDGLWRTDFYSMPWFPKFKGGQKRLFDENIEIAREIVSKNNKMIVENKKDKRGAMFMLIPCPTSQEEADMVIYIQRNCMTSLLNLETLVRQFGQKVTYVLDKYKVQQRKDGGYFIK